VNQIPPFEDLVSQLWTAHQERRAGSPRPAVLFTRFELEALRTGLASALVDRTAFDRLFTIYLDLLGPDPETEPSLPDHILNRVLASGLGSLNLEEIAELAVMPTWLAELADAIGIPLARPLLDSDDTSGALRLLIRRNLRAALDLLGNPPMLDHRRVANWLLMQLCGPFPLPTVMARRFFLRVAEELRDTRALRLGRHPQPEGATPSGDRATVVAGETVPGTFSRQPGISALPFAELVAGTDVFSAYLAEALRKLQISKPAHAELFLFRYYAGRTVSEIADLVDHLEGQIQRDLQVTEVTLVATINWLREQTIVPGPDTSAVSAGPTTVSE
jgi:hypothetical protein